MLHRGGRSDGDANSIGSRSNRAAHDLPSLSSWTDPPSPNASMRRCRIAAVCRAFGDGWRGHANPFAMPGPRCSRVAAGLSAIRA
jgi:hypothetical protein